MGFDGFFTPKGISNAERTSSHAAHDRGAASFDGSARVHLIPMGAGIGNHHDIDGLTSFGSGNLDKELATLEALKRSQAELRRKSVRFQGSSPEAEYLFAMAETLVEEDIPKREQNINNIFAKDVPPGHNSPARSLI